MRLWKSKKAEGLLAYYGLEEWWQTAFTDAEQRYIDHRFQPMGSECHSLTQGNMVSSSLTVTQFLSSLSTWFRRPEEKSIAERIHQKIDELARACPISKPGYYRGRHFTTYVFDVENLKRNNQIDEAECLLLELVEATEAESNVDKCGIAPGYYEELAKIYRKRKDYRNEVAILERFASQKHAPGVKPSQLLDRLKKARHLLTKSHQGQTK